MIGPLDAIYIDDRDAYPIEECVAKMLGWMQGLERLHIIHMDEYGIPPDKLAHLPNLVYTLKEHLDELKERARLELDKVLGAYIDAEEGTAEKDTLSNIVDEKQETLKTCSKLIIDAYFYKSEIKTELARGESSILKIDQSATEEKGDLHITLESLDKWAKKYRVNIIDFPENISVAANKPNEQATHKASPWMIPDPLDPASEQSWYIAARYFARECIREQPNLANNRKLLVIKIEKKLKENGVYKRGGKKTPSIGTILKALSNIGI